MRVLSVCEYLMTSERPQEHWAAFKFIRAIKAEDFNRYANVPVGNVMHRLTMDNRDDALQWAGEMLAPHVTAAHGSALVNLVPIPGSQCTSKELVAQSRGFQIASALVAARAQRACTAKPLLWWDQPMTPAHRGGSRHAEDLAPHYRTTAAAGLSRLPVIVLVDDVLTGAGHFRAAAAVLKKAGYRVADCAFAVARTVWPDDADGIASSRPPTEHAFSVATESFDDFRWP